MARRRRNKLLVPEARAGLDQLKARVMSRQLGGVSKSQQEMKVEMARQLGVPMKPGYNGDLKTAEAGKVGGPIGGQMVREMVKMAQEELVRRQSRP